MTPIRISNTSRPSAPMGERFPHPAGAQISGERAGHLAVLGGNGLEVTSTGAGRECGIEDRSSAAAIHGHDVIAGYGAVEMDCAPGDRAGPAGHPPAVRSPLRQTAARAFFAIRTDWAAGMAAGDHRPAAGAARRHPVPASRRTGRAFGSHPSLSGTRAAVDRGCLLRVGSDQCSGLSDRPTGSRAEPAPAGSLALGDLSGPAQPEDGDFDPRRDPDPRQLGLQHDDDHRGPGRGRDRNRVSRAADHRQRFRRCLRDRRCAG